MTDNRVIDDIWNSEKFDNLFERANLRISRDRAFLLLELLTHALNLEGDVCEMGVYKGSSAYLIADTIKQSTKTLHLFDTFEGTPKHSDNDNMNREGLYADTSLEGVQEYLGEFKNLSFHKGFIPDTLQAIENTRFCFAHLHLNLFQSTKDAMEFIYPRINKGGVILIEDYGLCKCAGVKKASDAFCEINNTHTVWLPTGQGMIIKS